jgi:uncharacterized protein YoxC
VALRYWYGQKTTTLFKNPLKIKTMSKTFEELIEEVIDEHRDVEREVDTLNNHIVDLEQALDGEYEDTAALLEAVNPIVQKLNDCHTELNDGMDKLKDAIQAVEDSAPADDVAEAIEDLFHTYNKQATMDHAQKLRELMESFEF